LIKTFVRLNRQASNYLAKKIPSLFGEKDSSNFQLDMIHEAIANRKEKFQLLEAGGIDRPLVSKSEKYTYIGLDIEEKDTCYIVYDKFIVDSIENELNQKFDLIISKTLLEHVENNKNSYRAMYLGLNEGGEMIHYFPGKNHPFSVLTTVVGNKMQRFLIKLLRPHAKAVTGYKAYYDLCSYTPLKKYLDSLGFKSTFIKPYWGAADYFAFFLPAFIVICLFNRACEKLNLVYFASGLIVAAKK